MYSFGSPRAEAYYNQVTQTIHLQNTSVWHLAQCETSVSRRLSVYPTIAHELRHWHDHLGTLWGQRNLITLFNALNARAENDPQRFWHIVEAVRALHGDLLDVYYTVADESCRPTYPPTPWQYQLTCGLRFSRDGHLEPSRPIVFTQFADESGKQVARVPFSVTALLEACAVHEEWRTHLGVTHAFQQADHQFLALKEFERATQLRLYAPELAVYHVAHHLLSNRLGISDFATIVQLTAPLATLALNLPADLFISLDVPPVMAAWGEKTHALLESHDRGFAFVLLAHAAPMFAGDLDAWLQATTNAAGLPNHDVISEMARAEMITIRDSPIEGPFVERAKALLDLGRTFADQRGPFGIHAGGELFGAGAPLPPLFLADNSYFASPGVIGDEPSARQWIEVSHRLIVQIEEFYEVCGL